MYVFQKIPSQAKGMPKKLTGKKSTKPSFSKIHCPFEGNALSPLQQNLERARMNV